MSRRPRRNHAPSFKAKVALEAMKGDQKIVEFDNLRRDGEVCLNSVKKASVAGEQTKRSVDFSKGRMLQCTTGAVIGAAPYILWSRFP
jgi:hypothetical protein